MSPSLHASRSLFSELVSFGREFYGGQAAPAVVDILKIYCSIAGIVAYIDYSLYLDKTDFHAPAGQPISSLGTHSIMLCVNTFLRSLLKADRVTWAACTASSYNLSKQPFHNNHCCLWIAQKKTSSQEQGWKRYHPCPQGASAAGRNSTKETERW